MMIMKEHIVHYARLPKWETKKTVIFIERNENLYRPVKDKRQAFPPNPPMEIIF